MLITSQGAGVLWVLEVSVTYSNLHNHSAFSGGSPINFSVFSMKGAQRWCLLSLVLFQRQLRGSSPGKEESVPYNSSQCCQITSGCLV